MRIVVFSHSGGSPHHGPNMRWYYLGQALQKMGHRVDIVSASYFHKYYAPEPARDETFQTDVDGLSYTWVPTRRYRKRGRAQVLNQWDYVRRAWSLQDDCLNGDVDVVVASSPHPFVIYPAWRLARKRGAQLVFEVRDLWPLAIKELGQFSDWHPYMLMLSWTERFAAKVADAIVSVKPGDIDYFRARYGIAEKTFCHVPNGFLPEKSSVPSSVAPELDSSVFNVGYVGALSAYYGLDALIDAAERLRESKQIAFTIVGGGDDEQRLRETVKNRGLENIRFAGSIPRAEVPATLQAFDLCYVGLKDVTVNRYGISCNKLFEYMDAGKPVLASYRTDHDPVLAARCGLTVAPGQGEAIAEAILWFEGHRDEASEMGRRGQDYFVEHHEFSRVAVIYQTLMERLTGSRT